MIGRRGELMAELFLQELGATFIAKSTAPDIPYDFFIGFATANGGLNIYAVEVKATEQPISSRYPLRGRLVGYLANSNIPVLLLIVDVKRNRLYYTWGDSIATTPQYNGGSLTVMVPVIEIDDSVKTALRDELMTKHLASSGRLQQSAGS
jgi:hypothetical protein